MMSMDNQENLGLGNRAGRYVAIVNMVIGLVLGVAVVVMGSVAGEHPLIAMLMFIASVAVIWWRIHQVFRNIP